MWHSFKLCIGLLYSFHVILLQYTCKNYSTQKHIIQTKCLMLCSSFVNFCGTGRIRTQLKLRNFDVKYVLISWSPFCKICVLPQDLHPATWILRSSQYSEDEHGSVPQTCIYRSLVPAYLQQDMSGRGLTSTILTRVRGSPRFCGSLRNRCTGYFGGKNGTLFLVKMARRRKVQKIMHLDMVVCKLVYTFTQLVLYHHVLYNTNCPYT